MAERIHPILDALDASGPSPALVALGGALAFLHYLGGRYTETLLQDDNHIADQPVVVAVTYPFKPILGMVFGGITITLKGTSTMLHE